MEFEFVLQIGAPIFLLLLGYFTGSFAERRHLKKLDQREKALEGVRVTQLKTPYGSRSGGQPPTLLVGETVIATDYFKSFLARWRNLFGGEVKSYRSLMSRARRESLLRIQQQARDLGYNAVCNVRFETADVGGNSTMRRIAMVSIVASGTAYEADA